MKSFVTENDMINLKNYLMGFGDTPLGESIPKLSKSKVLDNFNNYDNAITITIKGSNKLRLLEGDLYKQYNIFRLIMDIIDKYVKKYIMFFELHKCGLWLHSHGVVSGDPKDLKRIKQEIFQLIEGEKIQKYQSYSRRIKIDKIFDIQNWLTYIQKDEEQMLLKNSLIKKIYKI